jgi:hypothetical protein
MKARESSLTKIKRHPFWPTKMYLSKVPRAIFENLMF